MANRDINLVVRAKDEASRALQSIAGELDRLIGKQEGVTRSGPGVGNSIATMVAQLAKFEQVSGLVAQAADRSEAAISRQQKSLAQSAAALSAVNAQLASAQQAISKQQSAIVDTKLAGGDTTALVAGLKAAQAEVGNLEVQQRRLTNTAASQTTILGEQQRAYREVASMANAAESAVKRLGDQNARTAAQAESAAAAERRAAATRAAVATSTDARTGKSAADSASVFEGAGTTRTEASLGAKEVQQYLIQHSKLEDVLGRVATKSTAVTEAVRERTAADEAATLASNRSAEALKNEARQAESLAASQRMAAARASFNGPQGDGNGAPRAGDTALAQLLRNEDAAAKEADRESAALQNLLDKTNPVAAIHRRLAADIDIARAAMTKGKLTAAEFAAAEAELTRQSKSAEAALGRIGNGASGKPALFGLKPYELTNLGYQVNDVVSGLAMGQRPMQIIAQQGGQILQLMPNVGSKITAAFSSPKFLGAATVFALIAMGIKSAADQAERLRTLDGVLGASANGLALTAKGWNTQITAITKFGVSVTDAMTITKTFFNEGLNPMRFVEFSKTARDMADVLGVDVTEAAKMLSGGLKGNYEAVSELDDKLNFLTATQREHIRSLYEQGRAQEASAEAAEILARKMDAGATKMRGPWTDSLRSFRTSWNKLVEDMGNTWWADAGMKGIRAMADGFAWLTESSDKAREAQKRLYDEYGNAKPLEQRRADAFAPVAGDPLAAATSVPLVGAATKTNDPNSIETKQSNDTLHAMGLERELQKLRQDGAHSVENLRFRNEGFLSGAAQRRRAELAGELAATKAVGDQRVKDAAREDAMRQERDSIQRESDQFNTASSTPAMQSRRFIMEREGFRQKAYWDVNHFRVGYGSDTTTTPGGATSTVTKSTTVTQEGALRDLDRRIAEFQKGIKDLVGGDRFGAFSSEQQAALTSVAYNYGTIGKSADGKHGAGISDVVRSGTIKEIADAIRGLAGQNGGVNRARRNREADIFLTPNSAIEADNEKQGEAAVQRQSEFNASVERTVAEQKRHTVELDKQATLQGAALVQQQIKAAGEKAVADLERQIAEKNANLKPYERKLELTEAQRDAARQAAEAEARASNVTSLSNAQTADAMRKKDDLAAERDAILAQVNALRTLGDEQGAQALIPQLRSVNAELLDAISNSIAFLEALDPETDPLHRTREQIDAAVIGLRTLQTETARWHDQLEITAKQIQDSFSGSFKDAVKGFSRDLADGKNVFESFGKAALTFASSFLQKLGDMGLDSLANKAAGAIGFDKLAGGMNSVLGLGSKGGAGGVGLTAAGATLTSAGGSLTAAAGALMSAASAMGGSAAAGGKGGGILGSLLGAVGGMFGGGGPSASLLADVTSNIAANPGIFHTGGFAGSSAAPTRAVNASWFKYANRYHSGGIAGLRPDEVPAILQRGEEVLTRGNPRHSGNQGGAQSPQNIKIVNAFDAGQVMSEAMGTEHGQKAFINFVRSNKRLVNNVLKNG